MATLFELDRRYKTEAQARVAAPYLAVSQWRVVKDNEWYRLQFTTDRPAAAMAKTFAKLYPGHTFRVLEADDEPQTYLTKTA